MLSERLNKRRLTMQISRLRCPKPIILALDFDELVVVRHITRDVCAKLGKTVNHTTVSKLGPCSFKGILYLNNLLQGVSRTEFEQATQMCVKKTPYRRYFRQMLAKLQEQYCVIFIGSGLKEVYAAKLQELGFNHKNVFGSELSFRDGHVVGSSMIVSNTLKGFIVRRLKKKYKVIAVGHSHGDQMMLDAADVGISFSRDIRAKHYCNSFDGLKRILHEALQ